MQSASSPNQVKKEDSQERFKKLFSKEIVLLNEWEELKKLVKPIHQVWGKFKSEILSFLSPPTD